MSEIWAGFDEDLIRRSFVECGIVASGAPDPLHSSLRQVLDGIDVREYLEDVVETPNDEVAETNVRLSFYESDSDSDDDEFVPETDGETSTDSDFSDASDDGLADLLNRSTIQDDFDEPPIPTPEPARPKRDVHAMRRNFF